MQPMCDLLFHAPCNHITIILVARDAIITVARDAIIMVARDAIILVTRDAVCARTLTVPVIFTITSGSPFSVITPMHRYILIVHMYISSSVLPFACISGSGRICIEMLPLSNIVKICRLRDIIHLPREICREDFSIHRFYMSSCVPEFELGRVFGL
jgi:hypothetical protein